ncbi:U7 snRNA-associated Sm-like protein LSm11 [Penaeus indicus]|uniref:U7 snRNA-associated Sm-like protein LSm11 n=1 Tax=Penaeus indicus TaxID=29960 RepID=UPI00300CA5EA
MASRDELDFLSESFNPEKVLSSTETEVPVPEAEEYEDLNALRNVVHSQTFNVVRELPGVYGHGGIPKAAVNTGPVERKFTEDQGLLQSRGPRRRRNVISRMQEMKGPLAVLRRCKEENIRVKVYTRNQSEVRGVLTGFVVAFDKHWNLALRDVDEVFQKKIRCKKHALGDVSRYLNVGDLSIQDDLESVGSVSGLSGSEEEAKNPRKVKDPTPAWVAAATWDRHTSLENTRSGSRRTTSAAEAKPGRDPRGVRPLGVGGGPCLDAVERRALDSQRVSRCHPHTSEARDALRLQLGHGERQEEEEEEGETKKKRRRRKKREIRKRHVNQLLVRGENVVLISVMEP